MENRYVKPLWKAAAGHRAHCPDRRRRVHELRTHDHQGALRVTLVVVPAARWARQQRLWSVHPSRQRGTCGFCRCRSPQSRRSRARGGGGQFERACTL